MSNNIREGWKMRRFDTARAARAALTVRYASLNGWVEYAPGYLTDGLRDAYHNGLSIALPTGPNELGWAMIE